MINALLIEDDTDMAYFIECVIKKSAMYRFLGNATTAREGRIMIAALKPDIVFLDNYLPDGTGLELIQFLRADFPTTDVIFITAANDIHTIKTAVRYGAYDYLVKPFLMARLNETLINYYTYINNNMPGSHWQQSDIDHLLHAPLNTLQMPSHCHPKGIDAFTLEQVRSAFTDHDVEYTSEMLGQKIGISKSTARRYLEYCKAINQLEARIEHGTIGRPQRIYRLAHSVNSPS